MKKLMELGWRAQLHAQVRDRRAAREAGPRLRVRLQAGAVLQRLVPHARPAERRRGHRAGGRGAAGGRPQRRRRGPRGRRDHLRHGLRGDRVPRPDAGDRRRRRRPAGPLEGQAPAPSSACACRTSPTCSWSTAPTPTSAAARSSTCWSAAAGAITTLLRHAEARGDRLRGRPPRGRGTLRRPRSRGDSPDSVWASCHNWYHEDGGRISTNWPGTRRGVPAALRRARPRRLRHGLSALSRPVRDERARRAA